MDKFIDDLTLVLSGVTRTPMPPIKKALEKAFAPIKLTMAAADTAEQALDKVLRCHTQGHDALMYTPRIDSAWSRLKTAREAMGRECPKPD